MTPNPSRNHAAKMLQSVALGLETTKSREEEIATPQAIGLGHHRPIPVKSMDVLGKIQSSQLVSEYRVLRPGAVRLRSKATTLSSATDIGGIARFNKATGHLSAVPVLLSTRKYVRQRKQKKGVKISFLDACA
jgi:hypothetical protein